MPPLGVAEQLAAIVRRRPARSRRVSTKASTSSKSGARQRRHRARRGGPRRTARRAWNGAAAGHPQHMLRQHVQPARPRRVAVQLAARRRPGSPPRIPAPRTGWPAPARRARPRPCGDWRGRPVAAAGSPLSARRPAAPGPRRPSRCRDRARRSPPPRAAVPAAIAASTRRRCSGSRLPWWMAIGRVASFSFHSSWNSSSAWARVLTNTMVMPAARMRAEDLRRGWPGPCGPTRAAGRRQDHADFGRRAAADLDHFDVGAAGVARHVGGERRPVRDRRRQPDPPRPPARGSPAARDASASWSPRLVPASACTSSITIAVESPANCAGASGSESSTARLSGVVSRMLGGVSRWRRRRSAEVSPVRVSMVMSSDMSLHRPRQVAGDVGGQRLQRADIERVQAGARRGVQVDQAGQEPGERLAAAGRRDQQHAAPGPAAASTAQLVRPRRPALAGEPRRKKFRQCSGHSRLDSGGAGGREARTQAPAPCGLVTDGLVANEAQTRAREHPNVQSIRRARATRSRPSSR